jgi:adenylate cyclase
MRRNVVPLLGAAVVGILFGMIYRYFLDEPTEATVANYLRSGVLGAAVAAFGWAASLYFNVRASRWLRTWK